MYAFYVHPDFQRVGVGTALFNAFKEKIKGADKDAEVKSNSKAKFAITAASSSDTGSEPIAYLHLLGSC